MLTRAVQGLLYMSSPGSSTTLCIADMPRSVAKILSGPLWRLDGLDTVAVGGAKGESNAWYWAWIRPVQPLGREQLGQYVDPAVATRLQPWLSHAVNSMKWSPWLLPPDIYRRQILNRSVDQRWKRQAGCEPGDAEARLNAWAVGE